MSRNVYQERRALLELLLKDASRQGFNLITPPLTSLSSPAFLDSIDVNLLIRQLEICSQVSHINLNTRRAEGAAGDIHLNKCMAPASSLISHAPPGSTTPSNGPEGIASYSFVNGILQPSSAPSPPPPASPSNPFGSPPPPTHSSCLVLAHTPSTPSAEQAFTQAPDLSLKELETSLTGDEAKLLSFLVFTLSCGSSPQPTNSSPQPTPLWQAAEALKHCLSITKDVAEISRLAVSTCVRDLYPEKRVTLEGLVTLLVALKPSSTPNLSFSAFSTLQSTLSSAIKAGLSHNSTDGWTSPDLKESIRLIAKIKSSLRRLSFESPDDFEPEDHYESGQALWAAARSIASKTRMGWMLPWGIRVKICEVLQLALFDSRPGAGYVPDHSTLLGLYERSVYPPLGISPILSLAIDSWTHFRHYFSTRELKWLTQLKFAMSKLLSKTHAVNEPSPAPHDTFNLGADVISTDANVSESCMDLLMAKKVAGSILDHACLKLGDFYRNLPNGGASIIGLLDVLSFASKAKGDDQLMLTQLAARLVVTSTLLELQRQASAITASNIREERISALLRAADSLLSSHLRSEGQIEALAVQTQILPLAASIASLTLYRAVEEELMPWMSSISTLDPTTIHLSKEATRVDERVKRQLMYIDETSGSDVMQGASAIMEMIAEKGGGRLLSWASMISMDPASLSSLNSHSISTSTSSKVSVPFHFKRWDLATPLKAAMNAWATSKCSELGLWTQRQLQMDAAWRKVSDSVGYGHFAIEVSKVNNDTIDAAFEMGLPVPQEAMSVLLTGIDSSFHRCASYILDRLGTISRLVPPLPNPTRFKKEVVIKQEKTEQAALEGKPPPASDGAFARIFSLGATSKPFTSVGSYKEEDDDPIATSFLESVPKIESSPDYVNISQGLENSFLLVAIHSSSFLKDKAMSLAASTAARWYSENPPNEDEDEEGEEGEERGRDGSKLQMPQPSKGNTSSAGISSTLNPFASPSPSLNPFSAPSPSPSPSTPARNPASPSPSPSNTSWINALLSKSLNALESSINYSCNFLAHKITFWDMRQLWLERLYRHHVKDRRIKQEIIGKIDRSLFESCTLMNSDLRLQFASALLKCSIRAMERVLLDGGPCRWFIPSDVSSIEADLDALCATFRADGEGLDGRMVEGEAVRVRRLFRLMALEVGPLIDLFKQSRASGGRVSLPQTTSCRESTFYEEEVILRVLARRPERLGSKVLKEAPYKLGKKLRL